MSLLLLAFLHPPSPEVSRVELSLSFSLDFEGDLKATVAEGDPNPVRTLGRPVFKKGRSGRALLNGNGFQVQYRAEGNLDFRRGAVSFWTCLLSIPSTPSGLHVFWLTPYSPRGYLGIEVYTFPGGPNVFFWLQNFEGLPNMSIVGPRVDNWRAGEWHHIVLSWWREVWRLFADGEFWAECRSVKPLRPSQFPEVFQIGSGRGPWRSLLDDFRIYNRPLSGEEIRMLSHLSWPTSESSP